MCVTRTYGKRIVRAASSSPDMQFLLSALCVVVAVWVPTLFGNLPEARRAAFAALATVVLSCFGTIVALPRVSNPAPQERWTRVLPVQRHQPCRSRALRVFLSKQGCFGAVMLGCFGAQAQTPIAEIKLQDTLQRLRETNNYVTSEMYLYVELIKFLVGVLVSGVVVVLSMKYYYQAKTKAIEIQDKFRVAEQKLCDAEKVVKDMKGQVQAGVQKVQKQVENVNNFAQKVGDYGQKLALATIAFVLIRAAYRRLSESKEASKEEKLLTKTERVAAGVATLIFAGNGVKACEIIGSAGTKAMKYANKWVRTSDLAAGVLGVNSEAAGLGYVQHFQKASATVVQKMQEAALAAEEDDEEEKECEDGKVDETAAVARPAQTCENSFLADAKEVAAYGKRYPLLYSMWDNIEERAQLNEAIALCDLNPKRLVFFIVCLTAGLLAMLYWHRSKAPPTVEASKPKHAEKKAAQTETSLDVFDRMIPVEHECCLKSPLQPVKESDDERAWRSSDHKDVYLYKDERTERERVEDKMRDRDHRPADGRYQKFGTDDPNPSDFVMGNKKDRKANKAATAGDFAEKYDRADGPVMRYEAKPSPLAATLKNEKKKRKRAKKKAQKDVKEAANNGPQGRVGSIPKSLVMVYLKDSPAEWSNSSVVRGGFILPKHLSDKKPTSDLVIKFNDGRYQVYPASSAQVVANDTLFIKFKSTNFTTSKLELLTRDERKEVKLDCPPSLNLAVAKNSQQVGLCCYRSMEDFSRADGYVVSIPSSVYALNTEKGKEFACYSCSSDFGQCGSPVFDWSSGATVGFHNADRGFIPVTQELLKSLN